MTTLGDLVEQVVAELNQFTTNQERTGTFTGWQEDGALNKTGINLADISSDLSGARVELETGEIVHVSGYSSSGQTTTCPAWFRGQMGTPQNDTVATNSRVIINPQWPRFQVARKIAEGVSSISQNLFAVAETDLVSAPIPSNYELPDDCVSVISVTIQDIGPSGQNVPIRQWSMDAKNSDGKVYLRLNPLGVAGRTVRVTYRKAVVPPDPADLASDWADTGLPESASDLPGLYAKSQLILSPEAAKTQQQGVEQGERQRTLQGWSATSVSRRWQEIFAQRLDEEQRKLLSRWPVRPHKELV